MRWMRAPSHHTLLPTAETGAATPPSKHQIVQKKRERWGGLTFEWTAKNRTGNICNMKRKKKWKERKCCVFKKKEERVPIACQSCQATGMSVCIMCVDREREREREDVSRRESGPSAVWEKKKSIIKIIDTVVGWVRELRKNGRRQVSSCCFCSVRSSRRKNRNFCSRNKSAGHMPSFIIVLQIFTHWPFFCSPVGKQKKKKSERKPTKYRPL